MPRWPAAWARVLIAGFVVAIALQGLATIAGVDRESARGENRALAPPPAIRLDWPTLSALPDGFTRYFEDGFAFRTRLVRWQAAFRLLALHVSPSPDVVIGRDGWLFYADDGAVEDYAAATPLSAEDLEVWRRTLQNTQDWLRRRGIAYLFVIAPDKHAIYPEFMPSTVHRLSPTSRSDQLAQYLIRRSTVNVLDLRPALLAAKAGERIYHRTDTHWNDRGAFVASQQIIGRLGADTGMRPLLRSAFAARDVLAPGMDLAGMLGLGDVLSERDLGLVPIERRAARVIEPLHPDPHGMEARLVTEHPDAQLPRAVVFRDSFGSALVPFLSGHFSRAVYLWQYDMDPAVVAEEHPSVVIQEWVGRRLSALLPYDAVADMKAVDGAHNGRDATGVRRDVSSTAAARR